MPTRIILIRHGDTAASQAGRFTGAMDLPLSKDGRVHASELATRLGGYNLQAVYASSMQRAMDTAKFIAQVHALEVIPLDALREIQHGHWDGLTHDDIQKLYPDELAQYDRDPFTFAPEGGESGQQLADRAIPAILEIVRAHPEQVVAVIAHQATNRTLIAYFLGLDLRTGRDKIGQRPACVNVLDFNSETDVATQLLNDISHYGSSTPPETQFVL